MTAFSSDSDEDRFASLLIRTARLLPLNSTAELNEMKVNQNLEFDIEVDGGINFSNSTSVINAGANILVSGTTIFKENKGDVKKNIDTLRSF